MLFGKKTLRERPVDPYQSLSILNQLTTQLLQTPGVSPFALSMGVLDTCHHLGWTPEEMVQLDDAIRRQMVSSVTRP